MNRYYSAQSANPVVDKETWDQQRSLEHKAWSCIKVFHSAEMGMYTSIIIWAENFQEQGENWEKRLQNYNRCCRFPNISELVFSNHVFFISQQI